MQIDEEIEILIELFGILFHEAVERFAFDEFPRERPFSVDDGDFQNFRNVERSLLDARLIERLVQDPRFGIGLIKRFDEFVAVAINLFADSRINEFHALLLIRGSPRAVIIAQKP